MKHIAKVLLPLPFDKEFDYLISTNEVYIGDVVQVPFGKKQIYGVVRDITENSDVKDKTKLKPIIATTKNQGFYIKISDNLLKLIDWQAEYTITPKGMVLSLVLNDRYFKKTRERKKEKNGIAKDTEYQIIKNSLNQQQQNAFDSLKNRLNKFSVTLLEGVTGSGKTEVYFEAVEKIITQNKQALLMLPEILLTSQMLKRFEKKFGFKPIIWHSIINLSTRKKSFFEIANGSAKVVIGARSALHLPYKNLGLIIVDEEHDDSYKQEDNVVYNARDMAIVRAKFENISIILSSATPSIETYYNAISNKYFHEKLEKRFKEISLPQTELIDMRTDKISSKEFISHKLRKEIENNLKSELQTLLFLNRRGYAPLTLCSKCGFRFKSPDTSAWMVMHINRYGKQYLQCHHSGFIMEMPKKCPSCNTEDSFRVCGPGIQRLSEEVKKLFPNARILELASDTTNSPKKMQQMIETIERREVDIIIGTQIIAKGHHFPALNLVGVIDGDLGLDVMDLRSHEKVFQLLYQVSGRAGRDKHVGRVYIQTYQPENKVMKSLLKNDLKSFLEQEIEERKSALYPPFSRLCAIIISAINDEKARQVAKDIAAKFSRINSVKLFGPAPALYHEYRGQFRYRILLKSERNFNIQKYVRESLEKIKLPKNIKLKIDVDPHGFS